ncbi:hypothetical protein M9435_003572 [Picochlorum sp. BPE23]|nr:hypothetical protein M9435_003572 [Picochlorum sp. BPE23]
MNTAKSGSGLASPKNVLQFLHVVENLKKTPRTGWVKRQVAQPESIADHMYRMSLMSLLMDGSDEYNYMHCIKLSIVHDLAECIVGDITPTCGVSDGDKHAMEAKAMDDIGNILGDCAAKDQIQALWREYEAGETPEAKLVKDFDKFEMIVQAHEYEQAQGAELQEFFDSTSGKWRTPVGEALAAALYSERGKQ